MLSFKIIDSNNRDAVLSYFSEMLDTDGYDEVCTITESFVYEEDTEFAVCLSCGCFLVRVFDMGNYIFLYPFEISDLADPQGALSEIVEYAKREEIPLAFSAVPGDCLGLFSVFRHMDIDAEDPFGESFSVKVKTECALLDEVPESDGGRVKLTALREDDIPLYAELSKSENVNKYWGYNYKDDMESPSDEYFYEIAARDFSYGTAMSLAVRFEGEFCGEVVLYAFDGMGGSEFAIRLLQNWQGRGLGRDAVLALTELARRIGLVKLYSVIMKDNVKSLAMLDSVTEIKDDMGESVKYQINLY